MTRTQFAPFGIVPHALLALGLLAGTGWLAGEARGADKPAATAPPTTVSPETKAWADLQKAVQPQDSPEAWKTKRPTPEEYKAFVLKQADAAAAKVADFLTKYPRGAHASEARQLQINIFQSAATLGGKERETELAKLLNKTAKDTTLPDNDRVAARFAQINSDVKRTEGADRAATMKLVVDGVLAVQKDFPKCEAVYVQMLELVSGEGSAAFQRLARAVTESPDAPAKLKQLARDMIDGKVFSAAFAVGKPVSIKFTAVDGTEVDLAKLKGKVVLVDFWATWCGPCIAELPRVKETYQKLHSKGFEIVGISFEREGGKEKLVEFTKEKSMPWPQYYDGKFWENKFGKQFNIHAIPAMWLIDKKGNLADLNAREGLATKVAQLLEAK